jgi:ParB-like chromosome segregation protein Spo0J
VPDPIPDTLASLVVPVDGLVPYPSNPRKGNLQVIVDSLERHGQYRPIVVRAKTFEVLAGNHTLAAAKALGWHEIAATFVDCTDDEAARIVLVDNRTNDLGRYDDELLANVLASLPDLDGTGYDADDLDLLLALREPHYGGDLERVLEVADESVWPWVRAQLDPALYEVWKALPGEDDTSKLVALLAERGA